MALINCPNCNNLVSDKAIKCPHCGIELTPVESVPNTEVNAPLENVESISQIDQKLTDKTSSEASHTLRNVLIGIVALLVISGGCGALQIYYSSNKEITTSSNLDIAKIVGEIDRDMAAKANNDAIEKQNAEKRLEEFKNFKSNDLAAFMLHGKVKKVTSYFGGYVTLCEFDEFGVLTKYEYEFSEHKIYHDGNQLRIINEDAEIIEVYKVINYKLVKMEYGGFCYTYSDFDSNNCPMTRTWEKIVDDGIDEPTEINRYIYTDIDEYGNWTTSKDENGKVIESRKIEYYPIQ